MSSHFLNTPHQTSTIGFTHVVKLIKNAQQNAVVAVNTQLIGLYWQVGAFTRRNLFRMRQFYEAYREDENLVSALLTQLPWTHHLMLLSQCKSAQEREFYMRSAVVQKWSSRELDRQLGSALFERMVIRPAKLSPALQERVAGVTDVFKDA